jgi:hypothetical protein
MVSPWTVPVKVPMLHVMTKVFGPVKCPSAWAKLLSEITVSPFCMSV